MQEEQEKQEKENKKRSFFDVLSDIINHDMREFGEEMREFGKKFKHNFQESWQKDWGKDWIKSMPLLNVIETAEGLRAELAVPGLQKDAFKITLKDNHLTISAELDISLPEGEKFRKREFNFGKFHRSVHLPEDIDTERIEAKYEEGILKINLPKKAVEADEQGREIPIQ